MKRALHTVFVLLVAAPALIVGQGVDVAQVLASARKALTGDKGTVVKTLSATGRTLRSRQDGTTSETDFEMSFELPDKFMKRELIMAMGPTSIYRQSGFNGDGLINWTDAPPSLSAGGGVRMMAIHPGSGGVPGQQIPKEQMDAINKKTLAGVKADYARLSLGLFAAAPANLPLEFTYGGQAESKDGKAHVIDVKGPDFAAKLFLDGTSHLPLMLSWMDKEPLVMTMSAGGGGGGAQQFSAGGGQMTVRAGGSGEPLTQEEMARMQREAEERMKEADAKRRIVEHRMFYADYKVFDGVKLPTRIQRMVEGRATEEITFDRIKVNAKIDPKKFEVNKAEK